MSTKQQPSIVKIVEGHVEHLIADHQRLTERNRDLAAQCDKLRVTKRELQERVAYLEKELSMTDLGSALVSIGNNSGSVGDQLQRQRSRQRAKSYVNRLMREVDECIAFISSPEGLKEENEPGGE